MSLYPECVCGHSDPWHHHGEHYPNCWLCECKAFKDGSQVAEIASLRAALAAVEAERDRLLAGVLTADRLKYEGAQAENERLRPRVAALEAALRRIGEQTSNSTFKAWVDAALNGEDK